MSDEKLPLILTPGNGLTRNQPIGRRIISEMVSGALALKREAETALVPQFRLGNHVLCEPDYRQVLIWGQVLEITPESVLERLLLVPSSWQAWRDWIQPDDSRIENGRLTHLTLDYDLLPLAEFEWVPGLSIRSMAIWGKKKPGGKLAPSLPRLARLMCYELDLSNLDLSGVPLLTTLDCGNNQLTDLDLTAVPWLTELQCGNNRLAELDLTAVIRLESLSCHGNLLKELDITRVPNLKLLLCAQNQLGVLDLTEAALLTELHCGNNQLTELDLAGVPALVELSCMNNQLTELNLKAVPQLEGLSCGRNQLSTLDVGAVPKLNYLSCKDNRLTELDIRSSSHLQGLSFDKDKTRLIHHPDQHF